MVNGNIKQDLRNLLIGFLGGIFGVLLLAAVPATGYFGTFNGPVRAQNLILTNYIQECTNPITAGLLDCSLGYQITQCTANPTFTGVSGVTNGLGFNDIIFIGANGANRTVTAPANVHVYPSGTLIATNGSFAILSLGGVGNTYTAGVFLAFP